MRVRFMDFYTGEFITEKIMDVLPNENDLLVVNNTTYEIIKNRWFCLDTKEGDFISIFVHKS